MSKLFLLNNKMEIGESERDQKKYRVTNGGSKKAWS